VNPGILISEEITKITGITNEQIEEFARPEEYVFADLIRLISKSQYVMAHFGNDFDRKFYDAALVRIGAVDDDAPPEVHWLDSAIDIKYRDNIKTRNLKHLAAEHNFLSGFSHRAVFDVLTMLRVASNYDLAAIVARSNEPTLCVEAIVSFQEKDKAKERGYRWFAGSQTARKCWWKQFKISDYEIEKETCGFDTFILPGAPE